MISARSARGRSWRASTSDTQGWCSWRDPRRRSPARCMSDGPATMTSQGAAARSVSARARSGALTESSRRQSQSVALVTQGGDVRAAELDVESLAERQDEGVVEAREQRVQGRERQVGDEARRRVEGDVEDRDGGGAAQEAAQ